MYVCLCHGLTTRDITQQAQSGCGSVAGVYKRLGCRPQCGKCIPDVRRLVDGCNAAGTTMSGEPVMAGAD